MSVQSYVGCSKCTVNFPKGNKGPVFGVARRHLPDDHPLRCQIAAPYQYPAAESAGPSVPKTTAFVRRAAAKAASGNFVHFLGQKGLPMFDSLEKYCYEHMDTPDWMHMISR